MEKKVLIVVDISSFIFRAFYAIRPLNASDGTPVNALYGVITMLLKLVETYKPTHLFIARDTSRPSFRSEIYSDYKANRSAPPEDLIPQFPLVEKFIHLMNIKQLSVENYEADDVIASVVTQWRDFFDEVLIASSDKDLMQFVDDKTFLLDTKLEKKYGEQEVFEKMGVRPDQIVDYLALLGDSSDNIPGVKGVGAKGAAKLLAEYQSLENIYRNLENLKNQKLRSNLIENKDDAYMSQRLASLTISLDLKCDKDDLAYRISPTQDLLNFLDSLNLKSIHKKMLSLKSNDNTNLVSNSSADAQGDSDLINVVQKVSDLKLVQNELENAKKIALAIHYDANKFDKVAITADGHYSCVVLFNSENNSESDIFENAKLDFFRFLWSESKFDLIYSFHLKQDLAYLLKNNIIINAPYFDIELAHYNVDVNTKHNFPFLVETILNQELPSDVLSLNYLSLASKFAFEIGKVLESRLKSNEVEKIFYQLDNPLNKILVLMELKGICLDVDYLSKLGDEFNRDLNSIEKEIQKEVQLTDKEELNLRSPKQVSELLFEKLKLPVIKKIKTGFSTDSEVLETLSKMNLSSVPDQILKYRELDKLLSTYVSVLPEKIDPIDGRVHTTFYQTVAATGRLSSENPNLQNIPIRSTNGKRVRKAFVPQKGFTLVSADYSQIELRLLAHFSEDDVMVQAFHQDKDIHAQTASEVFKIPLTEVSADQRSFAKAVNFGLMYGQTSFGLSKLLGISRNEAKDYITQYFFNFQKVKSYLDFLKEQCLQKQFAETLFGRKRFLPKIASENHLEKAMAERMAINTPLQGTAADIIKKAMIDVVRRLERENFHGRLLLQVHDELVFEVPHEELNQFKDVIKEVMESVVSLKVPLKVDIGVGNNWQELK